MSCIAELSLCLQDALLEEVGDMRWGQFKSNLADAIVAHLEPIQQKYHDVIADKTYLDQVLACFSVPGCPRDYQQDIAACAI